MRVALTVEDFAEAERLCADADAWEQVALAVRARRYDEALAWLNELAVGAVPDPLALQIRVQIVEAEKQIVALETELSEAERLVFAFNRAYYARLGVHLAELLKIKQEIYRRWAEKDPSRRAQYDEAQSDYERLRQASNESPRDLAPDVEAELKEYFKKAAKLCHPDAAPPDRAEEAAAAFISLKAAFDRDDLNAVKDIYSRLSRSMYHFAVPSERAKLRLRLQVLREKIAALQLKIGAFKAGDSYRLASELTDWNAYFAKMQLAIEDQIRQHRKLRAELNLW
jgi:hypothetical protein